MFESFGGSHPLSVKSLSPFLFSFFFRHNKNQPINNFNIHCIMVVVHHDGKIFVVIPQPKKAIFLSLFHPKKTNHAGPCFDATVLDEIQQTMAKHSKLQKFFILGSFSVTTNKESGDNENNLDEFFFLFIPIKEIQTDLLLTRPLTNIN